MAVHASPDAPAVDLLVDGAVAGTGLTFPTNTAYLPVSAGTRNVKINVSGTAIRDQRRPAARAGTSYTVFACDKVASISTLVLTDNLAAPRRERPTCRFVHLSPDAPAVDVAIQGVGVLFANRAFKQFSAFTRERGTYNLEVRPSRIHYRGAATPRVSPAGGQDLHRVRQGLLAGSGAQALGAQIIVNN